MLVELASVIPDGIVEFFVSYSYMDTIVSKWDQMGVLQASKVLLLRYFVVVGGQTNVAGQAL